MLDEFSDVVRVPGTAVFMFKDLGKAPPALVNNLRHNKVLHRTTLIVSVETVEVPRVDGRTPRDHQGRARRVPGAVEVRLHGGARRDRGARRRSASAASTSTSTTSTFFIGHESIIAGKAPGMHPLREHLFVVLNRGADSASRFFNLPNDRIFEVGSQVEI